jgi:hypothetical protein
MARWIAAAIILAAVPFLALGQGVDNPGTNPQDVTCNEFGVCNSVPGGGTGGTIIATDDAAANLATDDADANLGTN